MTRALLIAGLALSVFLLPSSSALAAPGGKARQARKAGKRSKARSGSSKRTLRPPRETRSGAGVKRTSSERAGTIDIRPRASDPGIEIKYDRARDSLTVSGTTRGAKRPVDAFGIPALYDIARGVSFTLDIHKAPTTDAFGRTNYTEKNSRIFTLTTQPGWSAGEVAERLAAKVNKHRHFAAEVTHHENGTATMSFSKR